MMLKQLKSPTGKQLTKNCDLRNPAIEPSIWKFIILFGKAKKTKFL